MRMIIMKCLSILLCLSFGVCSLNILSFNIQNFGKTKYSKQDVIDTIIDIIDDFDLILIMELVDVSQTVLPGFVQQLNSHVDNSSIQYNYTVSIRLGRSNNKEQYVFLYRINAIELLDTFQYLDVNDSFERPPYSVLVQAIKPEAGVIPPFFIVASHIRPTDALNELNSLDEAFNEAKLVFSTDLGMIMGDLNADCSYLSNANYDLLDLIIDTNFTWWIDKLADTTTSNSNCAYDRIITRSDLFPFVVEDSVEIFLFDNLFNLSFEQALAVSDHYPLRITLQGNVTELIMNTTISPTIHSFGTSLVIESTTAVYYSQITDSLASSTVAVSPTSTSVDNGSGADTCTTTSRSVLVTIMVPLLGIVLLS